MEITANCPKCGSLMEEGFVADYGHGGSATVSKWVEGAPQRSFWTGVEIAEPRQISTYRCTGCGYLESYAK